MASVRRGFGTDFVLENEMVGIGTDVLTNSLEISGNIDANNITVTGISTFTVYDGFLNTQQNIKNTTITNVESDNGNLNSLSGDIIVDGETSISDGTTIGCGILDSLTVTDTFTVPMGGVDDRGKKPTVGTTRFNQDFGTLEFYTGVEWRSVNSRLDMGSSGRGVIPVGTNDTDSVQCVNIHSTGNSVEFGNLVVKKNALSACSSSTRGLVGGGYFSGNIQGIDYLTIAAGGQAADFGDLFTNFGKEIAGTSSSTRGIFAGGYAYIAPNQVRQNVMQYVQISTTGNTIDFGDIQDMGTDDGIMVASSGCSNGTRGLWCGGYRGPAAHATSKIDMINIASLGNSLYFGDLSRKVGRLDSCSNSVMGLSIGGRVYPLGSTSGSYVDVTMDRVIIASTGNAVDFGKLTIAMNQPGATSNSTRAIFAGGYNGPAYYNIISYVDIATLGDAMDFGDLSNQYSSTTGRPDCAFSDSHGGLGGF